VVLSALLSKQKNDLMPDRLTVYVCAMCVQCMCIQYGFVHIKWDFILYPPSEIKWNEMVVDLHTVDVCQQVNVMQRDKCISLALELAWL